MLVFVRWYCFIMFCSSCVAVLDRAQVWAILKLYPKTGIHSIFVRTISSLHLLLQGVCGCVGVCGCAACVSVWVWVCVHVVCMGVQHGCGWAAWFIATFDLTKCSKLPDEPTTQYCGHGCNPACTHSLT